ncbi:hypothetical protein Plec18170_005275 [Paecilomyces lecythidis]
MEWSLDFCLVCDRQTCGGAYCSQACRLAELDGFSTGSSLSSQILSGKQTSLGHTPTLFPTKTSGRQSPESGSVEKSTPRYQLVDTTAGLSQSTRTLSPSSSETSLTSLQSNSSRSTTVSDQVWNELCDYASCFDHVRDWRRRLAVS